MYSIKYYRINDEDVYVKSWAKKSLCKLKSVKYLTLIINLLKHNDLKIRIAATKALAKFGNKKALKLLIEALDDDNWDVRQEIEKILNHINPEGMNSL